MKSIKIGDKITLKRFIKIPQELIDDHELTNDARIIYSCLLDRTSLSLKNSANWFDDRGKVFIKFKQQDLAAVRPIALFCIKSFEEARGKRIYQPQTQL